MANSVGCPPFDPREQHVSDHVGQLGGMIYPVSASPPIWSFLQGPTCPPINGCSAVLTILVKRLNLFAD
jgi:hypothetical protein